MLSMCSRDCLFVFNDCLYQQLDGVAMGSPLRPSFANIFLCYHEQIWLDNCPSSFKPLIYCRYVHNTFVVFKEKDHATLFLDYLNKQHINIEFTLDKEINSKLPFLDLLVQKNNDKFSYSVFRKQTFSGLGTSFFSTAAPILKWIPWQPYSLGLLNSVVHIHYFTRKWHFLNLFVILQCAKVTLKY